MSIYEGIEVFKNEDDGMILGLTRERQNLNFNQCNYNKKSEL